MYLKELGEYKDTLIEKIKESPLIRHLVLNEDERTYGDFEQSLALDKYIYPYLYVPETQTETKTYICVDVIVPRTIDFSLKNLILYVNVFSHRDLMMVADYEINELLEDYCGTRPDIICDAIDRFLDTSTDFGIGRLKMQSAELFKSDKTYYGRLLQFTATDFNTKGKL